MEDVLRNVLNLSILKAAHLPKKEQIVCAEEANNDDEWQWYATKKMYYVQHDSFDL